MSLQVFQSGHHAGTCIAGVTDDYANFACRARAFALRFRCIGDTTANPTCTGSGAPANKPAKPAVNVEGQYETLGDNETRVQTRHTAWNSGLSGSPGFNIGVPPDITTWSNPGAYAAANHRSDEDLGRMKGLFKSMPWSDLVPRHDVLIEQNNSVATQCDKTLNAGRVKADWLQLWKPLLAVDIASGYGLAYLPRPMSCKISATTTRTPSTSVVLNRAVANGLGISCGAFAGTWISPGDTTGANGFQQAAAGCSESADGTIKFYEKSALACGANCDRVLRLSKKTSGAQNSPNILAAAAMVDLETDVELSDDGQASTVTGSLVRNGLPMGDPVPLSGAVLLFRKLPSVALDPAGNFLVVWEEGNAVGTDDIVASRFKSRLEPLGAPFVLNDTTEGQQAEPWASGDDSGNTVVVWTSYSEDDEIAGDIYGKVLDSSGLATGPEFLISTDNLGNQSMPQVQMDGDGGFVVAWSEEPSGEVLDIVPPDEEKAAGMGVASSVSRGRTGGVYYRVFDAAGRARGPERRVDHGNRGPGRLSALEVHRHGGFRIRWRNFDSAGRDQGESEEEHDRDGNPTARH